MADEHVKVMNMTEMGVYISLMCVCWTEQTIPNDAIRAGRLCDATDKEMKAAWPTVRARFIEDPEDATRLRHGRMDKERFKQARNTVISQETGFVRWLLPTLRIFRRTHCRSYLPVFKGWI